MILRPGSERERDGGMRESALMDVWHFTFVLFVCLFGWLVGCCCCLFGRGLFGRCLFCLLFLLLFFFV